MVFINIISRKKFSNIYLRSICVYSYPFLARARILASAVSLIDITILIILVIMKETLSLVLVGGLYDL